MLTVELVDGPLLLVVEVRIAAVLGEEGVRQGAAGAVEPLPVAVLPFFEPDVDVHSTLLGVHELDVSHVTPHLKLFLGNRNKKTNLNKHLNKFV